MTKQKPVKTVILNVKFAIQPTKIPVFPVNWMELEEQMKYQLIVAAKMVI